MRYIFIIFILFFNTHTILYAATFNSATIHTTPELPKPLESVGASVKSYSYDLQSENIKWFINNSLYKEGVGLTNIRLLAPKESSKLVLRADIANLTTVTRIINPATVDILWEANTTTPRWYRGRALPVDESTIRATAIPHIYNFDSDILIYNWYKNGHLLDRSSGVGRQTITTSSPNVYNKYTLTVDILDKKGHKLTTNGTVIHSTDPEVLLYNNLPLLGIINWSTVAEHNNASKTPIIEPTLTAVPFFYTTSNSNYLTYTWSVAGSDYLQNSLDSITLINTKESPIVNINVSNDANILQYSASRAVLRFSDNDTNNDYTTGVDSPFGTSDNL